MTRRRGWFWDTVSRLRTCICPWNQEDSQETHCGTQTNSEGIWQEKWSGSTWKYTWPWYQLGRGQSGNCGAIFREEESKNAIRIGTHDTSMNLDCGLSLSRIWNPVLPTWLNVQLSSFTFLILRPIYPNLCYLYTVCVYVHYSCCFSCLQLTKAFGPKRPLSVCNCCSWYSR